MERKRGGAEKISKGGEERRIRSTEKRKRQKEA